MNLPELDEDELELRHALAQKEVLGKMLHKALQARAIANEEELNAAKERERNLEQQILDRRKKGATQAEVDQLYNERIRIIQRIEEYSGGEGSAEVQALGAAKTAGAIKKLMPLQVFDDIEESETSFTGTTTVQILNATELRLNGVNIDSRYVATAGEQTITGLKTFNQIRLRNVRVKPLVTGSEASLLFYDNVDDIAPSQTGDLWRAGVSISVNNRRSFVLAPDQVLDPSPQCSSSRQPGYCRSTPAAFSDAPTIRQNNVSLNDLLAGKQDTLTASTSNTPILNGNVVRSLQASQNISISTANNIITISADLVRVRLGR
jgi:hypothetical protein